MIRAYKSPLIRKSANISVDRCGQFINSERFFFFVPDLHVPKNRSVDNYGKSFWRQGSRDKKIVEIFGRDIPPNISEIVQSLSNFFEGF